MVDWYWPEADQLEAEGHWNRARDYMLAEWKAEPHSKKKLIRLSFLCWYVLVEWQCLDLSDLDYDEYINLLRELTDFGLVHFHEDAEFLWVFGYMSSLFAYCFGEYEEWEQKGLAMLERAFELEPNDPVTTMLFLGSKARDTGKQKAYEEACQDAAVTLSARFKGNGEMQQYFRHVLHRV
jgi:hypothetical protein